MKPRLAILSALLISAAFASAHIQPGSLTPSGTLVIHVFQQAKTGRPIVAEVKNAYGYMVINTGKSSGALYRLASNELKRIEEFTDFEDFKRALAKIPRGSELVRYDKCLAPTHYGLSFDWSAFENFCAGLGLRLANEDNVTCTCPDEG
jgi:hypothetical protein